MKKYKAIFFDWDGTAVTSRKAPADEVALQMKALLGKGVPLVIVSGTTFENIAGGEIHRFFTLQERKNLYLGLGRGAYNYAYNEEGQPYLLSHNIPDRAVLLRIHKVCYEIHETLYQEYGFPTDIVFSRPNYCKIDLMVENHRGDQLFFQEDELTTLQRSMQEHGMVGGLKALIRLAEEIGEKNELSLSATTDAKYLEVGMSSKSDNVNAILAHLNKKMELKACDCAFWGDEYIGMDEGLYGSDSFMITEQTKAGDFFDVSEAKGKRPDQVQVLGGGVERFLQFLQEQADTK